MKNINIILFGIIALLLFIVSCKKDDAVAVACFTTSVTEAIVGDEITFANCSEDATNYTWKYQILEATDHYGGRIQKNEDFADFPIDLGAEWIHTDKSILNELIGSSEPEPDVETILYQPTDFTNLMGLIMSKFLCF